MKGLILIISINWHDYYYHSENNDEALLLPLEFDNDRF